MFGFYGKIYIYRYTSTFKVWKCINSNHELYNKETINKILCFNLLNSKWNPGVVKFLWSNFLQWGKQINIKHIHYTCTCRSNITTDSIDNTKLYYLNCSFTTVIGFTFYYWPQTSKYMYIFIPVWTTPIFTLLTLYTLQKVWHDSRKCTE